MTEAELRRAIRRSVKNAIRDLLAAFEERRERERKARRAVEEPIDLGEIRIRKTVDTESSNGTCAQPWRYPRIVK